jgi:hypothetical protein
MEPSEPLRLAMMTVCEAAERVQHSPPETAHTIADRVAGMINVSMDRAAVTLTKGRMWALAVSAGIALYAVGLGGFGLGWIAHGSTLERECMTRGSIQNAPDGKGRFCAFWLPQ